MSRPRGRHHTRSLARTLRREACVTGATRERPKLVGWCIPAITLTDVLEGDCDLEYLASGRGAVFYLYPGDTREERADAAQIQGFREREATFAKLGIRIVGISAQDITHQIMHRARHEVDHLVLADPQLALARSLHIPIYEIHGRPVHPRLALLAQHGQVQCAWVPAVNPAATAAHMVEALSRRPRGNAPNARHA